MSPNLAQSLPKVPLKYHDLGPVFFIHN